MSALDDLRLGARFAVSGGREGWIRTILTAVGVGLGVSLLLITAAIPNALAARDERGYARGEFAGRTDTAGRNTLLLGIAQADFRDLSIRGRLVQAEGPDAPVPPGLTALPGPGELAVSPELRKLLDSDAGALLRERLKGTVTAVISDEGLLGPHELSYFQGTDRLVAGRGEVVRLDAFEGASREGLDSTMMLLVLVALVVLLVPVAVLIAAAVRFGGERRDRRLAALRLVGADARSTRWVAAGETFVGALGGLLLGGGLFFLARSMARLITLESISVFPSDLVPAPWLVLLICGAVPASAVLVTLLALRGVVIEPLGVVRTAKPVRRRLWWRLLLPAAGLALLVPQIRRGDAGGNFDQFPRRRRHRAAADRRHRAAAVGGRIGRLAPRQGTALLATRHSAAPVEQWYGRQGGQRHRRRGGRGDRAPDAARLGVRPVHHGHQRRQGPRGRHRRHRRRQPRRPPGRPAGGAARRNPGGARRPAAHRHHRR
ncbi:FtsX-like permease family protein [Streptomyces cremeus]|uniref:FtsX-like permease family protein n=1 Tax=Streptomyces cremeus TaxID=66881 RepID=UPI0031ED271E